MSTNYHTAIATGAAANAATFNTPLGALDAAIYRALGSGTSFPGSPAEGDRFWRTDQNKLYVYDGSGWVKVYPVVNPYAFIDLTTASQSISASTETKVQLNNERFSSGVTVDVSTNYRITVTQAGVYQATGSVRYDTGEAGDRFDAEIRVNGSRRLGKICRFVGSTGEMASVSGLISLSASDYVELYAFHSASGAIDVVAGAAGANTFLSLHKISD